MSNEDFKSKNNIEGPDNTPEDEKKSEAELEAVLEKANEAKSEISSELDHQKILENNLSEGIEDSEFKDKAEDIDDEKKTAAETGREQIDETIVDIKGINLRQELDNIKADKNIGANHAEYTKLENIKNDAELSRDLENLGALILQKKADEKELTVVYDQIADKTGLYVEDIRDIYKTQAEKIVNQAKAEIFASESKFKRYGKIALRSGLYIGAGALSALVGLGIGGVAGIAAARIVDRTITAKLDKKKVNERIDNIKTNKNNSEDSKAYTNNELMAALAIKKQKQLDKNFNWTEDKQEVIDKYVEAKHSGLSKEDQDKVKKSINILIKTDEINNRFEEKLNKKTLNDKIEKATRKFMGETVGEKTLNASVMAGLGIAARQIPGLRNVLMAYAGWSLGSVAEKLTKRKDKSVNVSADDLEAALSKLTVAKPTQEVVKDFVELKSWPLDKIKARIAKLKEEIEQAEVKSVRDRRNEHLIKTSTEKIQELKEMADQRLRYESGEATEDEIKNWSMDKINQRISDLEKKIETAQVKDAIDRRNEYLIKTNTDKIKELEEIAGQRSEYDEHLSAAEAKYKQGEESLYTKDQEIQQVEDWDQEKRQRLIAEKAELEKDFQDNTVTDLDKVKSGEFVRQEEINVSPVSPEDLARAKMLFNDARLKLLDKDFQANQPAEYLRLKSLVNQYLQIKLDGIGQVSDSLAFESGVNQKLSARERENKRALAFKIGGAVLGAIAPELIHHVSDHFRHSHEQTGAAAEKVHAEKIAVKPTSTDKFFDGHHINKTVVLEKGDGISKIADGNMTGHEKVTFVDSHGVKMQTEAGRLIVYPGDKVVQTEEGIFVVRSTDFKGTEIPIHPTGEVISGEKVAENLNNVAGKTPSWESTEFDRAISSHGWELEGNNLNYGGKNCLDIGVDTKTISIVGTGNNTHILIENLNGTKQELAMQNGEFVEIKATGAGVEDHIKTGATSAELSKVDKEVADLEAWADGYAKKWGINPDKVTFGTTNANGVRYIEIDLKKSNVQLEAVMVDPETNKMTLLSTVSKDFARPVPAEFVDDVLGKNAAKTFNPANLNKYQEVITKWQEYVKTNDTGEIWRKFDVLNHYFQNTSDYAKNYISRGTGMLLMFKDTPFKEIEENNIYEINNHRITFSDEETGTLIKLDNHRAVPITEMNLIKIFNRVEK